MRPTRSTCFASVVLVTACTAAAPPPTHRAEAPAQTATPDAESWRAAVPQPGAPRPLRYPEAMGFELSNGMPLYFMRRPGGLLSASLVALGGALDDEPGLSGRAALTARMMTEGTRSRTGLALAEAVEDLGANLEHEATRDHLRLGLSGLAEDAPALLALLAEVVRQPAFEPDVFERVRAEWLDALTAERERPTSLSVLAGFRGVLGPRLGAPATGSPGDVRALAPSNLARYHHQAFVAARTALCVAGDLPPDEARAIAESAFHGVPRGEARSTSPMAAEPLAPGIYVVDRPGAVQTAVFAGHGFPRRDAPGFEARQVMNDALGGLFTSRLNHDLREVHAYTYGARSLAIARRSYGLFAVMTSVRTDVTADALRRIRVELDGVQGRGLAPLSDAEIARAQANLVQSVGAHLEDLDAVRNDLETLFVDAQPQDYFATYADRLASVAASAVLEEARRIVPDQLVVVLVGDRSSMGDLTALGLPVRAMPEELVR